MVTMEQFFNFALLHTELKTGFWNTTNRTLQRYFKTIGNSNSPIENFLKKVSLTMTSKTPLNIKTQIHKMAEPSYPTQDATEVSEDPNSEDAHALHQENVNIPSNNRQI